MKILRAILVLSSVAAPALGEGGARRAVVLPPTWKGDFSETEKITLTGSLAASVAAQGYTVVEDRLRDATLEGDARLLRCLGTVDCKVELAERLDAELAVSTTVNRTAGPSKRDQKGEWLVTIAVLPLDVRRLGATDLRRCASCNAAQVEPIVTSLVGEVLARERKRGRATIIVRSEPPGAQVTLDGADAGRTELRRAVYAEAHVLEMDVGGKRQQTRFEASPGQTYEFRADPAAGRIVRGGAAASGGGGGALRPLGIVGIVAGVAAVAGGVGLLAIHGRGTCALMAPAEQCPQRYSTLGAGLGLTIGGAALAVVGAILAVVGGRSGREVAVAPLLLGEGGGLQAAGRF